MGKFMAALAIGMVSIRRLSSLHTLERLESCAYACIKFNFFADPRADLIRLLHLPWLPTGRCRDRAMPRRGNARLPRVAKFVPEEPLYPASRFRLPDLRYGRWEGRRRSRPKPRSRFPMVPMGNAHSMVGQASRRCCRIDACQRCRARPNTPSGWPHR